jgi:hypothetical protein
MREVAWAVVMTLAITTSPAWAVPVTLTHQGRLLDAAGGVIDGSRDLTVSIWSDATSTNTALRSYTETFSGAPVEGGYYSVILGSGGTLDAAALTGNRWVQVDVGGTPMLPRSPITSVPASANAAGSNLAGLDGITRPCPNGTNQTFNGATGTWNACPSNWNCASDPTHAGCVSSSTYPTCKAIDDDPLFNGTSGNFFIDPDGSSGGIPPFQTWCDLVDAGGGWTRIGVFNGDAHTSLSAAQAQAIPFKDARLSMNGSGTLIQINCYASATTNGLQTSTNDRQCTASPWFIRMASRDGNGDYGFYRGTMSTNHGGCSWSNGTFIWGRHHYQPSGACRYMGQGEDYQTTNNWNGNSFWMYVR